MTGSSRGIGRAVAEALSGAGASVLVNGRHAEAVEEVVESIQERGGTASGAVGSVADFEWARGLVEEAEASLGSVDILINCAGIAEPAGSSILDLSSEDGRS